MGRRATLKEVRNAEKRAKRAALQEKIDGLRGKEIAAATRAAEYRFKASRKRLEYERDRLRVRTTRRS